MTTLADRTIAALRAEHDILATLVPTLTDAQLSGPSAAREWTVAQVLSHLGSGSEISLASLEAATGLRAAPTDDFNPSVWARWDAMAPAEQRAGFLEHDAALVAAYEALDAEQRATVAVKLGFLPAPLSVAGFAGMRLNETAHHGWDVRVTLDPSAGLVDASAEVLAEQFTGELAFLLGFIAKADRVPGPVVLDIAGSGYGIELGDAVALTAQVGDATATLSGPLETALRLTTGRLGAEHTPADVTVTGNVTLDQLREVFPGY